MQAIIDWLVGLMEAIGAPGVGLAILAENIFPPIPSEVVLPLAGFTVAQGSLNPVAVFVWSLIGSVGGAYLLYGLGAWLGAKRLRAIAEWMWLVKGTDVDNALSWFDRHGKISVFFGRLVPGVRSLISIPAGLDRMNLVAFGLWTTLGSAIWNAILIALGYFLGDNWHIVSDYVDRYSKVVYLVLALVIVGFLAFFIRRALKERAGNADTTK
ncbi:DedA family protein [Corynebacterium liangguodongii]|uniref:Uncharacterized protein n=1 Tax=Corynebacterium liangguodongii TaxID=2079535 RepID=A0A2S0WD18_9CORY|nr:DedA family protein [Corynebacterium liangguodongii]AWB83650.1 hypothetical protein C3E79_03415 [Corynebacterium liangguodongii]PWB99541.1 DedA family protein [Corynebacterium liangguodongii]